MRIGEVRSLCGSVGQERNRDICSALSPVDEGFIYDVDRNILNHDKDRTPLNNIDDVLASGGAPAASGQAEPFYNTWPWGVKTYKIFPRFLAICRNDDTLNKVMGVIVAQSRKIASAYPGQQDREKTVILLTDKWDDRVFKKYEKQLLQFALDNGIWFIFLLVTDYGYTQIPFLPNDRYRLDQFRGERIEDNITMNELLRMLNDHSFEFEKNMGTWKPYEREKWSFNTMDLWWEREHFTEPEEHGDRKALGRFLEKMLFLFDDPKRAQFASNLALDTGTCTLRIFGREIVWDLAPIGNNRYVEVISEAINEFIDSCRKSSK